MTTATHPIYDKLKALNITLPAVSAPAAAYLPFVQTGKLVFLSGHLAKKDGQVIVGQLGRNVTTEEGKAAARLIAIDLMGTLHAAVGDLGKVRRIVKVMSLVNSTGDFTEQHWSPMAAANCWAKCSAMPASMPAARSAWRRSRWAPAWRSS